MGKIIINNDRCKGCGLCIEACKDKLIKKSKKINSASYYPAEFDENNSDKCKGCILCAIVCPEVCIEVYK